MTVLSAVARLPSVRLRQNRYFYLWYDGCYLVACLALLAMMRGAGFQGLAPHWHPAFWLLLPVACYAQIICSVVIHNCTHNNLPRSINRIAGELCGMVVLTRFASWEVIHRRHHRYPDDLARDPHPVEKSYWMYLFHSITNVEEQLQKIYFELYGDTPDNRAYEKRRALLSYGTNLLMIVTWYSLLGRAGFFGIFVPATIVGILHLIHFNWCTHNAETGIGGYKPVDLNKGFYAVGNVLFFGIYMHANHHKFADLFNPARPRPRGQAAAAAAIED